MRADTTTISTNVTLGHPRDSRASRVPTPTPTPTKTVQAAEGGALRESPRGAARSTEPDAARRPEEHRGSRRGPYLDDGLERTQVFRLLCALIRAELRAHPELDWGKGYTDLVEHMKTAAAKAQLPYGQDHLTRALNAIERTEKARPTPKPRPEPPRTHWRDRCAHTPRCATPTQCALKAVRG